MTNREKTAFENGFSWYQSFCDAKENSEKGRSCLLSAYNEMLVYIDKVDDFYDKLIFALVVEDMEACGFAVSELAVSEKTKLYQTLFDGLDRLEIYRPYLWSALTNMAKRHLQAPLQDDSKAKRCYELANILDYPLSDVILQNFICDDKGDVHFIGKRPEQK